MKHLLSYFLLIVVLIQSGVAQPVQEKIDTAVISRMKEEGLYRSEVMETLSWLTDVYGPRLTGSPEFGEAAEWAKKRLGGFGLVNVALESWKFGRGWSLKSFSSQMTEPRVQPLIAHPKAWSPSTKGTVRGNAVYLDVKTEDE